MCNRTCKRTSAALLTLASIAYAAGAHAAEDALSLGGVYGYGDHTRIYGLQAVWAPQKENEMLARHDLGLRLTAQVARWVASAHDAQYHSLTDGSVLAELRYWLSAPAPVRPFVEAGFGVHLLSHVHIAEQDLTTAFNFGSQAAVGITFGDRGRCELAALIHHASNAGIKQPNDGLTYGGIRLRVALQ
jgi:lipid A 3-O-deacylase